MVTTWEHTERLAPPTSRRQGFRKTPNGTGVHMHTAVCSPEQGLGTGCAGAAGAMAPSVARPRRSGLGKATSARHIQLPRVCRCIASLFPRPALGRTCYGCGSLRPPRVQDTRLFKERTQGADLA